MFAVSGAERCDEVLRLIDEVLGIDATDVAARREPPSREVDR